MPKPNCLTAGDPPSWDSADARGVKDWQPQPAWNYQDVLSGMRQGTDGRLGEGDGKGGLGAADKGLRQLWPGLSCRLGVEKRAKRRERVGWAAPINVGEKKDCWKCDGRGAFDGKEFQQGQPPICRRAVGDWPRTSEWQGLGCLMD